MYRWSLRSSYFCCERRFPKIGQSRKVGRVRPQTSVIISLHDIISLLLSRNVSYASTNIAPLTEINTSAVTISKSNIPMCDLTKSNFWLYQQISHCLYKRCYMIVSLITKHFVVYFRMFIVDSWLFVVILYLCVWNELNSNKQRNRIIQPEFVVRNSFKTLI